MEENKVGSKFWVVSLILISLVIIAVAGFVLFSVFQMQTDFADFFSQQKQVQNPQNKEPNVPAVENPGQTENQNDDLWNYITKPVVEKNCLTQAKEFAGSNAWAVRSCSCSVQESSDRKFYACSVSALDGAHPVSVDCTKAEKSCLITSEQGSAVWSFEQLAKIVE